MLILYFRQQRYIHQNRASCGPAASTVLFQCQSVSHNTCPIMAVALCIMLMYYTALLYSFVICTSFVQY